MQLEIQRVRYPVVAFVEEEARYLTNFGERVLENSFDNFEPSEWTSWLVTFPVED